MNAITSQLSTRPAVRREGNEWLAGNPADCLRVEVLFGTQVMVRREVPAEEAIAFADGMRRRFPSLRISMRSLNSPPFSRPLPHHSETAAAA